MVSRALVLMLKSLVVVYRVFVSPLIPPRCRFAPTCSEYALVALTNHGPFYGSLLTLKRISRCHPWGGEGYDPVPVKRRLECSDHSENQK